MTPTCDHIILLSADALRADHLSCHGYHRETSPVLDRFAEESIQFTRAYSASSHTREAVPALLTGQYPDVAIDENYRLATDSVASVLGENGYATGGFHSNPFVSRAYGFDRGFDTFDDDLHFGKHKLIALAQRAFDKLRNRHYARAEEINDRSLAWIDDLGSDRSVFLWNHYMDTHGPYEPPGEYATLYRDSGISDRDAQSLYQRAIKDPDSISDSDRQLLVDLYDAEIRYNDEKLGEFFDALRERDLFDRSLIIFTADHGDAFGEHGYYEHPRYLHDEITHVPLFVRPPGGTDRDPITTPVSTLDVVSTIEQVVGRAPGPNRVSLLDPGIASEENPVFLQARGENEHSDLRRYAVKSRDGSCYCERDRTTDSIEFGECSSRALRTTLEAHVTDRIDAEAGATPADEETAVDGDIERRLSALGYKE
ncbi:sulfatase [Salinigranum sp. GCM10025319]|uniref:sulfatase n=1 Tax=Salinigranum sp. GCM10025319 TaxID=3252687 RepID=UPI00361E45DD